jgi:hypothetical protein
MRYGYLRSGAPQWARGRCEEGAHLASFSLLGNPTAVRYRISGCVSLDLAFPDSFTFSPCLISPYYPPSTRA